MRVIRSRMRGFKNIKEQKEVGFQCVALEFFVLGLISYGGKVKNPIGLFFS